MGLEWTAEALMGVLNRWISVLNNAKEEVLMKAFQDTADSQSINQSVKELTSSILDRVLRLPGNKCCCDCGAEGLCLPLLVCAFMCVCQCVPSIVCVRMCVADLLAHHVISKIIWLLLV